jgi:hypothetical protein
MAEDARRAVEREFQKMTGGPEVRPGLGDGILVASTDGRFALLQVASEKRVPHPYHRHNYKLSRDLPAADGALVIRGSSVLEFETRLYMTTASEGAGQAPLASKDIKTNASVPFLGVDINPSDHRDDWKSEARRLADERLPWSNFAWEYKITARSIAGKVAERLNRNPNFHGVRGPRDANTVRSEALKGWKWRPPLA